MATTLEQFSISRPFTLAKARYENALFLQQNAANTLSQSVEQAFFNVSAGYKKFSTLKTQVADFAGAYKIAEVRYNAGVSNQVEYLIAKNRTVGATVQPAQQAKK